MKTKNIYDLNSLLVIGNCCICVLAIILYYYKGNNQYVDIYTVILLCIFGAENLLILLYERKIRDPFIMILMVVVLIFYMTRIVTLLYDPYSLALDIHSATPNDLNYSLLFILLSNASIFLGLSTVRGRIFYKKKELFDNYRVSPFKIIIILSLAITLGFYISLTSHIIGRFAGYITGVFIKIYIILLFTFIYLVINANKISRGYLIIFIILITIFTILNTLHGSRSSFLTIAYLLLVGILSIKGRIIFNNIAILIITIIVPLSAILFISATYIRAFDPRSRPVVSLFQLNILKTSHIVGSKDLKVLLGPIFDRMGFLDYSTEVIRNPETYSKIINFKYYFKSIVDNVLTPGFNIFGTPKASNSMRYVARGQPIPTHEDVMAAYHSDMLTVYGEYYVLFLGYPSLIFLFLFSHIFKKIYLSIRNKYIFLFYMYRALVLYVFYLWLNSFGIDWMMFDLVGIIITVCLFKNFYKMRRKKGKPVYRSKELLGDTPI